MKIPSLFRTPRYQRFNIEPRYYDPVKEEMEERTARIKNAIDAGKDGNDQYSSSSLSGAFKRGRSKNTGASFTQFIIMLLLAFLIFGYIYLGNIAFYVFVTAASLLLYLKMKRII